MVDHVATVPTQAFQIWLNENERSLGWTGPPGVTLSSFGETFDTWASMSHLIDREAWPAEAKPASIAYFCGAMSDDGDPAKPETAERADQTVRESAVGFLDGHLKALWPNAIGADGGFRWDLLTAPGHPASDDVARFDHQYRRANIDPSDRYVQSLPGSDSYRLPPGDTDFSNLVVAGDWTDCGLNAGCVEAATRSGVLAAVAVRKIARSDEGTHRGE